MSCLVLLARRWAPSVTLHLGRSRVYQRRDFRRGVCLGAPNHVVLAIPQAYPPRVEVVFIDELFEE